MAHIDQNKHDILWRRLLHECETSVSQTKRNWRGLKTKCSGEYLGLRGRRINYKISQIPNLCSSTRISTLINLKMMSQTAERKNTKFQIERWGWIVVIPTPYFDNLGSFLCRQSFYSKWGSRGFSQYLNKCWDDNLKQTTDATFQVFLNHSQVPSNSMLYTQRSH